jgi:hypothetical protein
MTRFAITWAGMLFASACTSGTVATSSSAQADMQMQGTQLQGLTLQGTQLQGMTLQGFQLSGATLNGAALVNVRIEHGELVAEQNQVTLHGAELVDAHLFAQVHNLAADPPASAIVEYRIANVETEDPAHDPTSTGLTFLYTLTQNVDNTGSWQLACPVDDDGRNVAIPLATTWDEHGDRVESTTLFTFGCTTGVIAKCYRWGYRPWVTGYGDLVAMHWTCTRLARADYCGDGTSHTRDGTVINVWDNLGSPGPIRQHGGLLSLLPPLGMLFEAGWDTGGAVCLSHARWIQGGDLIAQACPDRLIPPTLLGGTVCDLVSEVLGNGSTARMFDESYLNLNLDLF